MEAEVVEFPLTNINDIPAMLRRLASQIEEGKHGEVESLIIVRPIAGDYPTIHGFGLQDHDYHPIVQLSLAHHWLCSACVERD